MESESYDLVYTVSEVSKLLKLSPSTIKNRVNDGSIPSLGWKGKILIPGTFIEKIRKGEVEKESEKFKG